MYINDEQSIDGSHEGDDASNEIQKKDSINANILDKKQLEVLKSFVDWDVKSDRYIIFDQFFRLIGDWKGPLSDLRDIFQPEEIEDLLLDSICRWRTCLGENQAAQFIRFLVEIGHKDKPKIDKDGKLMLHRFTPILCAEYNGRYPVARELFKIYDRFDANYIDSTSRYSHFHVACLWGCMDIVEKFLELGQLDLNLLATESNRSPLQSALMSEHAEEVIEWLLINGADPNFHENDGSTILHAICCEKNDVELAKMVFQHCQVEYKPVQVDTQDSNGYTPIRHAVDRGNQSMIELLLRNGADPNLPDNDGSTPLHLICDRASDDADLLGKFFEICKDTRQKLQIEARDKKGRTPLQLAVGNIMPYTVDVLLDQGADLSSFVFPTAKQFDDINEYRKHVCDFKLQLASGLLLVVERLEKRGYELDQSNALTIMAFFTKYEVESSDVKKSWYNDKRFVRKAKKIMVNPSLSLYDLIRLSPTEAAKILTYSDYLELERSKKLQKLPIEFRINCAKHLCEKLARRFFRGWTLYPFWEKILHYRLPLLCCDFIIDHLTNKDLFNICLAATK